MTEACYICHLSFSLMEWEDRHTCLDGEDCHADCCDVCEIERKRPEDFGQFLDTILYFMRCCDYRHADLKHDDESLGMQMMDDLHYLMENLPDKIDEAIMEIIKQRGHYS
jgi:hypothetical protein